MQLYNALSQKKEEFIPIHPGKVSMYACGITAYDYSHIGHGRSAIVFDVLVRYLRHCGYEVTFVRNFTDIDDKIINRARQEGATEQNIKAVCKAISERFIDAFHEDMDRLGVLRADIEPKATDYIPEMINLCQTLIQKGHAYPTASGDVYFRVRSFAEYGKLSKRSVDDLRSGARIAPGEEKEDPLDFALWKSSKPNEPSWDSPWGPGRPGWHIECSAMSEKNLPLPLDIHGGGQDLIFPHHENEIAQTEAATGKELAKYWIHNGFVQINSEKMSKSLGNFTTIRDILKTYLPEVIRFFLLTRQYRNPIDFTPSGLADAEKNLQRIYETLQKITVIGQTSAPAQGAVEQADAEEFASLKQSWTSAMDDDLNTAAALGFVNNTISLANRIIDAKLYKKNVGYYQLLQAIAQCILQWSNVLGVFCLDPQTFLNDLRLCKAQRNNIDLAQVEVLMQKRLAARKEKDFAAADAVRDSLTTLGVIVRDTPEGAQWDIE